MKRNSLTTAVVAGIAGVAGFAGLANAVDLNPDGLGQVLIYPYYTVNKSQDTLFSVVNTDANYGKAVKVRFLEGYNSREVLDFNLYLSPNDVWTARVSQTADDGGGAVFTTDHSCTDPAIPAGGVPFRTAAFDGTGPIPADDGPQDITRTREGYIELIQMGDIAPGSTLDSLTTHDQDGIPNDGTPACGVSDAVASAGVIAPTGGLFGSGTIVNVGEGTFFAYNADALDGFSSQTNYSPSSDLNPSLQDAFSSEATNGIARAYVFINGTLVTADYAYGADAVSAVYMADAIYNEFLVSPGLGANTDWVITFPTKRFYVDEDLYGPGTPFPPFVESFSGGESNVVVNPTLYDREEGTTVPQGDFSPPISTQPNSLPFEVNVISFLTDTGAGDPSGVLGSILRPNIHPYGPYGWMRLDLTTGDGGHQLPGGVTPTGADVTFNGLPTTGFMAYNIINANAQPGMLANYGGLFRHRASRSCVGTDPACS
jgi:hypothetical protein